MAANPTLSRRAEERLRNQRHFRRNAFWIIEEMVDLSPQHPAVLVDEVLHSVFFLAKINIPPFTPEEIVSDDDMFNALMDRYPEPFNHYTTQLPCRSPLSCVLDMIVFLNGQDHEEAILTRLQEFIHRLETDGATQLVSSAICVSQADNNNPDSERYYGVSVSAPRSRQIVIGASCLSTYWDSYVAGAVMTYYPNKVQKDYFDGTFTLPPQFRCEAFKISDRSPMDPCRSCGNLFGLTTNETDQWPYGNCAECESVSNLLKNEQGVRENVHPVSDANRERAIVDLERELRDFLVQVNFFRNEQDRLTFYVPQLSDPGSQGLRGIGLRL